MASAADLYPASPGLGRDEGSTPYGPENVMEQIDQKQVDVLQAYLNTWLELQNIYWYEPTNTIVLFGEEVDKLVAERVAEDKKLE